MKSIGVRQGVRKPDGWECSRIACDTQQGLAELQSDHPRPPPYPAQLYWEELMRHNPAFQDGLPPSPKTPIKAWSLGTSRATLLLELAHPTTRGHTFAMLLPCSALRKPSPTLIFGQQHFPVLRYLLLLLAVSEYASWFPYLLVNFFNGGWHWGFHNKILLSSLPWLSVSLPLANTECWQFLPS